MSSGCDHLRLANDAIRLRLTGWACECGEGFPSRPFAPAPADPAPAAPAAPPKFAHACPNGHRDLQLRAVIDLDVTGADEDSLECAVDGDVDRTGGSKGIDSGVWCPACDEWFEEEECIWPTDAAGNPSVDGLGDAGPGEGDDYDPGSDDGEEDGSDGRP